MASSIRGRVPRPGRFYVHKCIIAHRLKSTGIALDANHRANRNPRTVNGSTVNNNRTDLSFKEGDSEIHGIITGAIKRAGLTSIFLNFGALRTDCPQKTWLLSSLCATWLKPIIPHPYQLFGACTDTEFGVATVLLVVALTRIDFRSEPKQYFL